MPKNENAMLADKLRKTIQPAFYRRVENVLGDGTPDTYVVIDGAMAWLEGKYCRECPARLTTPVFGGSAHPLLTGQENWLYDHWRKGGRGFVFAQIEDFFVLVPGHMALEFNRLTICQFDNFRVNLDMLRYEIANQPLVTPAGPLTVPS